MTTYCHQSYLNVTSHFLFLATCLIASCSYVLNSEQFKTYELLTSEIFYLILWDHGTETSKGETANREATARHLVNYSPRRCFLLAAFT